MLFDGFIWGSEENKWGEDGRKYGGLIKFDNIILSWQILNTI